MPTKANPEPVLGFFCVGVSVKCGFLAVRGYMS